MKQIFYVSLFYLFLLFPLQTYAQETSYSIEPIISNLHVPWSIIFTEQDRILASQRNGIIVEITRTNGQWQKRDYYTIPDVEQQSEAGLMGLAVHPDFDQNTFIYAMYAYHGSGGLAARVVRFIDSGSSLQQDRVIIDNLPCASNHCGGRIAFGPDGMLYVSVGDARQPRLAQDSSVLNGKILRITDAGQTPPGNPFGDLFTYSIGHRNVQGLTWHPETNMFFATEHGPSGIDGVGGGDEINVIKPGENYGWPIVSHRESQEKYVSPAYLFSPDGPPAVAPASAHIVHSQNNPWYGDLLIGALYEGDIIRCKLDYTVVTTCENLGLAVGRIRDIAENNQGEIFFSTSNRDGRSTKSGKVLNDSDDKIYQLIVKEDSPAEMVTPRTENDQASVNWFERLAQILLTPLVRLMGWVRKI
ncbi:MAG: PQQ-dependent sugar dehydrogenase [Candidatus Roizmanbacteria bacterium]|nr:PQQ-dependent sugar dehydrogenase [Candidatus Roizmanbacteria bacterium]